MKYLIELIISPAKYYVCSDPLMIYFTKVYEEGTNTTQISP